MALRETLERILSEYPHAKTAPLEEGIPVNYEIAADFAVLCPNCHRMIHRTADPSDVVTFRATLKLPK
jgi:predicted HNH restriction endonuclease